jgi:hypothetical protein
MTATANLLSRRPRVVHDHDWRGGLLWVLCACLALGFIDANDDADYWQRVAKQNAAELAMREARETLPNPAIILDATTAEAYGLRLADVAAGADAQRLALKRLPKQ